MPERSRGAELAALTTIAAQVNCTQELDEILAGALQTTLDVSGADGGEVFLADEDTGELILHTHRGVSSSFVADEGCIASGDCLCGLAAASGQPLLAGDIANSPHRSRPACLREGFRSMLSLPLLARGKVLGLLNVQSQDPEHFTDSDQELLLAIGNQIGIAIANAQLIDDAEQRRATLDSVVQSLVDGLVLVDGKGRVEYANTRAGELLGLPLQALLRQPLAALDGLLRTVPIEQESHGLPFAGAAADPAGHSSFELSLPGRKTRALQVRLFPIEETAHTAQRWGLLIRDISRERELDEMKSQLLSTVSHELRTPLASIKGFATTLLRDDVEWDEATRRDFLCIIDDESDRLTELIGNLLDMSRIEAGALRMDPEPTDLRPILEETLAQFEVMTREHHFRAHVPRSLPLVLVDPRRIRQVVRNLIDNAVKYSPQGGLVTVDVSTPGDEILIRVSDQGIGIAPEDLDRVFDRFFQVDSASTRKVGGSGLGLSISKAIVEAHSGRIWAESTPGEGSLFAFTLPVAREPIEPAQV